MRTKIDPAKCRLLIFGRVKPSTLQFLDGLEEPNRGRAIDRLVDTVVDLKLSVGSLATTTQNPK